VAKKVKHMQRPRSNEYPSYYNRYINLVEDDDVLAVLEAQKQEMSDLMNGLGEEAAAFRYAPDKWSVKEVIGHAIDVERIFAHRALRFARNDKTPLPEFDQDEYIKHANFDVRTLIDIADEYRAVRESTLSMFYSFAEDFFAREGTASGFKFTVRAVPFIVAGHEHHHQKIIHEKYISI
jgi:hypothetical protein